MTDPLIRIIARIQDRALNDPSCEWTTAKGERPKYGARCRDGHPCRAPVVWDHDHNRPRNGRCRLHGGLSSGPATVEGRLRALMNLKQYRALLPDRLRVSESGDHPV